jgi:hypothetical protein
MQPTQATPPFERLWHNTIRTNLRTSLQQYLSHQPKVRFAAVLAQSFRSDRDPPASRPCKSADEHPPDQYEICVKGHLDQRWSDWFEGFAISPTDNGETQLSGPVVDQAALYGLLIRCVIWGCRWSR